MSLAVPCPIANSAPQLNNPGLQRTERGMNFCVGNAFYRSQSAVGRDLSVLAAIAYKKDSGKLRVVDAMCGCGVRAMRYLVQANADYVLANDACEQLRPCIVHNLQNAADEQQQRWQVSMQDANKLLLSCYIHRDFYDLIDVDSPGGNSVFFGSALAALKSGGLVYVTSTDGFSCSKRPYNSLASYGAFTRHLPFTNEVGLRMVIGGVVREAATRNMSMLPIFSHYSPHGPVFRIMLRMQLGNVDLSKNYGFIAYCTSCGSSQAVSWDKIGHGYCCSHEHPIEYTGPLWTGPLHNTEDVERISKLAKELEWTSQPGSIKTKTKLSGETSKLTEVLKVMLEESHPDLPCGYIGLNEIASRARIQTPRRDDLAYWLSKEGYIVSRSQIEPNSIKTNAPYAECIRIARALSGI